MGPLAGTLLHYRQLVLHFARQLPAFVHSANRHTRMNAPVLVPVENATDPLEIAILELNAKLVPLVIRRFLPDGSFEDWACSELIVTE